MAKASDTVYKPEVNPRVVPLLAIMPDNWQALKPVDLRAKVEEILSQEDCVIKFEVDEGFSLLRTYAVNERLYRAEKRGKDLVRRTRNMANDNRIIGATTGV